MPGLDSRGAFLVLMMLALLTPAVAMVLTALAVACQGVLGGLNLRAGLAMSEGKGLAAGGGARPEVFFSVHVATHEEPPALVMRTLHALARQEDAPEFEVIVLDNNTTDPALWQPVAALCARLGPGFRFFHEEGVEGAKAGALNIALARTHPAASHIVVVDADYEVDPDFLAVAADELRRREGDFLQFPQAYRNDTGPAAGLSLELADYFLRHARQADSAGAMLLTGTLSVIGRRALEAAGGWDGRTLTEDAELGLRLRRHGFRGRFVDRKVGRGILPLDLAGLSQQRYRWAAGNVQTIRAGFSGLAPRAATQVFSQLTAWANLALPLAAGLIGGGAALALGGESPTATLLTSLSGLGLALVYLSVCLPMILSALTRGRRPRAVVRAALCARVALIPPAAMGTIDALLGRTGGFRRTAKDAGSASDGTGGLLPLLALAGVLLLVAAPLPWAGALGAVLLVLPYPLALCTRVRLSAYRASLQTA